MPYLATVTAISGDPLVQLNSASCGYLPELRGGGAPAAAIISDIVCF